MRMFVTGASGAPLSDVVRKVASSAGVPFASNATAASLKGTRFSIKTLAGGGACCCCALTHIALTKTIIPAANLFMNSSPSFADHCIQQAVDRLTVLCHALSQTSFKHVTRFLEHSRGCLVPVKNVGIQATEIVIGKRVRANGNQHLRSNTSSPKLFAQPVTDLRAAALHIVLQSEAYTTNCLAGHGNREISLRLTPDNAVEPSPRVMNCVRMRKPIAEIDRHVWVVCVTHNRVAVAPLPTPESTCCQLKLHLRSLWIALAATGPHLAA